MIIAAVIVGIIIIGLIISIDLVSSNGHGTMDVGVFLGVLITVCTVIEIGIISTIIEEQKPTPIDVYQGKTTLEYTIRDGEIIDSVVVFKEKIVNL